MSSFPLGLNVTENGRLPVGPNGEPGTSVSTPPDPTENTDTVLSATLPVASSAPLGLNATDAGLPPVGPNGEPAICVTAGCAASALAAPASNPTIANHDPSTADQRRRGERRITPRRPAPEDTSCLSIACSFPAQTADRSGAVRSTRANPPIDSGRSSA